MSNAEVLTKEEALNTLSAHLRKRGEKPGVFIKLLMMYGKLSGWDVKNLRKVVRKQRELKG